MTTNQQRIAIAQACGWTDVKMGQPWMMEIPDNFPDIPCGTKQEDKEKENPFRWWPVPQYTEDLNEMHEAEKILTTSQFDQYETFLRPIGCNLRRSVCATAAQRAEAFLRTLNLWTNSEE